MACPSRPTIFAVIELVDCLGCLDESSLLLLLITEDTKSLDDTHFPELSDVEEARDWIQDFPTKCWMIATGGVPIGLIMVHEPVSPGVPIGFLETGTFILKQHRRNGFATQAWEIAETALPDSCSGLAAVTWESNIASIRRLEKSRFKFDQRIWYWGQDPTSKSGWCEVWLKSLPDSA